VDYALFIVTRFRADLQDAMPSRDAVVIAMRTAGRAVLTAGTTVVIGMLGLLVLRQPLLNGVAIAAAATVAMMVIAALTLLPALLSFTGTRLARPSRLNTFLGGKVFGRARTGRHADDAAGRAPDRSDKKEEEMPVAQRWAGVVQRHPVLAAVLSAVLILALAAPALAIKLSFPDESAQARGTMGYASYATMAQGFGPGFDAPLIVTAKVPPAGEAALDSLDRAIAAATCHGRLMLSGGALKTGRKAWVWSCAAVLRAGVGLRCSQAMVRVARMASMARAIRARAVKPPGLVRASPPVRAPAP
jgi:RND superfamily putative drug exporter